MRQNSEKQNKFTHYVGIDWSGAKGKRHKGIAVAVCKAGTGAPAIVNPPSGEKYWSRLDVCEWIWAGCNLPKDARVLLGIDAAFAVPFRDEGSYFPGRQGASIAPDLWAEIAEYCAEEVDLFPGAFIDAHSDYYQQHGGRRGIRYSRRMRRAETLCIETGAGPCESVFNLVGASQVGKSALSTMHMLHLLRASPDIAIWPFETADTKPVCLVEIYAALFAQLGGYRGKMRSLHELNAVLEGLNSRIYEGDLPKKIDDVTDALVTAAGLRYIAASKEYWQPVDLTPCIRKTEGWIFGVK